MEWLKKRFSEIVILEFKIIHALVEPEDEECISENGACKEIFIAIQDHKFRGEQIFLPVYRRQLRRYLRRLY